MPLIDHLYGCILVPQSLKQSQPIFYIGLCQMLNIAHMKHKWWQAVLQTSQLSSIDSSWVLLLVCIVIFCPFKKTAQFLRYRKNKLSLQGLSKVMKLNISFLKTGNDWPSQYFGFSGKVPNSVSLTDGLKNRKRS